MSEHTASEHTASEHAASEHAASEHTASEINEMNSGRPEVSGTNNLNETDVNGTDNLNETDLIADAEELASSGKFEAAAARYDSVLKDDPYNPIAAVGKASVLKAMGKYAECADELGKALRSRRRGTLYETGYSQHHAFGGE